MPIIKNSINRVTLTVTMRSTVPAVRAQDHWAQPGKCVPTHVQRLYFCRLCMICLLESGKEVEVFLISPHIPASSYSLPLARIPTLKI